MHFTLLCCCYEMFNIFLNFNHYCIIYVRNYLLWFWLLFASLDIKRNNFALNTVNSCINNKFKKFFSYKTR